MELRCLKFQRIPFFDSLKIFGSIQKSKFFFFQRIKVFQTLRAVLVWIDLRGIHLLLIRCSKLLGFVCATSSGKFLSYVF